MQKIDIIKLAPDLSTKERIKLFISNWHKTVTDKPLLNTAEFRAVHSMTTREEWREFHYYLSLYQWSNLFLRDEIEILFLRIICIYYQLVHFRGAMILDGVIKSESVLTELHLLKSFELTDSEYDEELDTEIITIKKNPLVHPDPKEIVSVINNHIQDFISLRATVETIESELDGTPLFDEKTYAKFQGYWDQIPKLTEEHNKFINSLEKDEDIWKRKVKDKEQYLIQIFSPEQKFVDERIESLKELVNSDVQIP